MTVEHCHLCTADIECDAVLTCTERKAWNALDGQVSAALDEVARLQNLQRDFISPFVGTALQTWKWELHTGFDEISFQPVDRDLGRLLGDMLNYLPQRKRGKNGLVQLRDIVVIDKEGKAITIDVEFAENGLLLTPRRTEPIDEIAHRLNVELDLGSFIEQQKQETLKSIDDEIAYLQKQREDVVAGKRRDT